MSVDAWTPVRSAAGQRNPWLITFILSLATFMEVLDTSVANIALSHIGGSLSASYDEATWVLTSYLVANAVIVPVSGWLAEVIGRKRYYMISVALFTVTSLACALAPSLGWLIFFRILQGLGGGGLAPCEQSMLVDTFAPARRGVALAAYGLVLIMGPTLGPTIGGMIVGVASWRWLFLINVPVGLISLALVASLVSEPPLLRNERRALLSKGVKLDGWGLALAALGLGALQVVIDRGQTLDWLESPMIRALALLSAIALAALVVRELKTAKPVLDLRLFREASFTGAGLLMLITGAILYATTEIAPQYMQQVMGYTATMAGLAMTLSSLATIVFTIIAGGLANRVAAWKLIGIGLIMETAGLLYAMRLNDRMDFWSISWVRVWLVAGLPLILAPLTIGAYSKLEARATGQASAFLNLFRNIGGAAGIAAAQTVLARREPFHVARLSEHVSSLDPRWALAKLNAPQALNGLFQYGAETSARAVRVLLLNLQRQALVLSYIDTFCVLAVLCSACALFLPLMAPARRPISVRKSGASP